MTGDQERRLRVGAAAWAFMGLLDEVVPESAYYLLGERQDDERVNAYVRLIAECTRQDGPAEPST